MFDFRGQEIAGIIGNFKVTPVGLMAAAHAEGQGRVRAYIEYQQNNGWRSSFDNLNEDTRLRYLRIETRLREFENVQYND